MQALSSVSPPVKTFLAFLALVSVLLSATPSRAQTTPEPGGEKKVDPAFIDLPDKPGLPRVLLLGDSISLGYTPLVRDLLRDKANVHRPAVNNGPSSLGVQNLDLYLKAGTPAGEAPRKWDVIHFNFGLHDLKITAGDGREVSPADYEKNLRNIVQRLKATGAKLIWASTTPIPGPPLRPPRLAADVIKYNQIAARVMSDNNIPIDDLYSLILPRQQELQVKGNVHFLKQGYQVLAVQVASTIEKALPGN